MGTRCLTVLRDEDSEIAVLYRQFDGYPDGHGKEFASFLRGKRLINGFGAGDTGEIAFNGAACMAARIVGHFKKDEIGGFYLHPAGTRDIGEEYTYTVGPEPGSSRIQIECRDNNERLVYKGRAEDWDTSTPV